MNDLAGKVQLDLRSSEPIYMQIVRQMERLVTTGDLQPGDQLPTVRQLATELRVNFNTVARAYRILDEVGLISTQRGRGTFIWEKADETTARRIHQQSLGDLLQDFLDEAQRLGFSLEEVCGAWERNMANQSESSETVGSPIEDTNKEK